MNNSKQVGFIGKVRTALSNLKEDLYRNSVASAGPSDEGCCHRPVEELEKERDKYRRIAAQRKANRR